MAAEFPEGRLRFVALPIVADEEGDESGPPFVQRLRQLLATEQPAKDPAIARVSRHIVHYSQYAHVWMYCTC